MVEEEEEEEKYEPILNVDQRRELALHFPARCVTDSWELGERLCSDILIFIFPCSPQSSTQPGTASPSDLSTGGVEVGTSRLS